MKEEIIIKFINGECSEEEILIVKAWLKNPAYKKEFDEILAKRWDSILMDNSSKDNKNLAREFSDFLYSNQKPVRAISKFKEIDLNFSYYVKVAAVFLIFIISSILIYTNIDRIDPPLPEIAEIKFVKKEALLGQKLRIQLPDGTRVMLNSGSSLEYPEEFSDTLRQVTLMGEAFFEVKPNPASPFIVRSGSSITTVLGTFFNINDREEGIAEVTLTEGKVKVNLPYKYEEDVFLIPGEMAILSASLENVVVKEVDIQEITAWRNGKIIFKKKPLCEIFTQLEKWYNVKIVVEKSFKCNPKVSGEFDNESLENILSGLSFSFDFNYIYIGKEVKITK